MKVKCPGCGNFVEVDRANIFCRVCDEIAYPDLLVQKELSEAGSHSDTQNKNTSNHKSKHWDDSNIESKREKEEKHTKSIVVAICVVLVVALRIVYFLFF